jgi:hypothetical protein
LARSSGGGVEAPPSSTKADSNEKKLTGEGGTGKAAFHSSNERRIPAPWKCWSR